MTAGPPASLFAGTGLGEECVRMRGGIVEFANRESSEQIAWRESLGADIRVKPFPDYVTNDVERRLSELGFGLIIYLPYLSLQDVKKAWTGSICQRIIANLSQMESVRGPQLRAKNRS